MTYQNRLFGKELQEARAARYAPTTTTKQMEEKPSKPARRQLAGQIKALLLTGTSVSEIARLLSCDRHLVYWHKNKGKRGKKKGSLEDKVKRFNKLHPNAGLTSELVELATDLKCAFSGRKINLEEDSFCLSLFDSAPILYLQKYHRFIKDGPSKFEEECAEILRSKGWRVEREMDESVKNN